MSGGVQCSDAQYMSIIGTEHIALCETCTSMAVTAQLQLDCTPLLAHQTAI